MLSLESEKSLIEKEKGVLSGDTGESYKTEKDKAKLPHYRDQEEIVLDDKVFYTWGSIDARYATTSKVIYPTTSETAMMIPMKAIRQSPEYVPEKFGEEEYDTPGPVDLSGSVFLIPSQKLPLVRKGVARLFQVDEGHPKVEKALHRAIFFERELFVSEVFDFLTQNPVGQEILSRKLSEIAKLNEEQKSELEEAAGAEEVFLKGLTPIIIGAGLMAAHPELRVLGRVKDLPVLFAGAEETPADLAARAVIAWPETHSIVFAGTDAEAPRFGPVLRSAGFSTREVTPSTAGRVIAAILAAAAGMEEKDLVERAGRFLDAVEAFAGQV